MTMGWPLMTYINGTHFYKNWSIGVWHTDICSIIIRQTMRGTTSFQRENIKGESKVVPFQTLCHKGICVSGGMDSCFLAPVQIRMNGQLYVVAAIVKEKGI